MGLISVKISLADREYTLKVEEKDAATVRESAEILNQQIRNKKDKMKVPDRQDLLAFVAFDLIYEKLSGEKYLSQATEKIILLESLVAKAL